jgi:outer membrane protein OmpA-like peptidoglycan-associated protein
LVLTINKPVASVTLSLTRSDGVVLRRTAGALSPGAKPRLEFDAPVGVSTFRGTLEVRFPNGSSGSVPLDLSVEVAPPFVVETSKERIDVAKGEMQLALNRPAGRCDYQVLIEGKPVRIGSESFSGEPAGTWLKLAWRKYADDDVVLKIQLTCFDAEGVFDTGPQELYPWWIQIPHEDVNFESGKWEIQAGERSKLERAYEEIAKAVQRYGKFVDATLYVVGHTDTVADAAYNRELSQKRAREIAAFFRKRGATLPIWTCGRGEDALAVSTPDNTDEPRNRRAEYIIGVDKPFVAAWQRL